ncbi:MAG: glycosyltransferase family 2 protein [Saprospiraceae bacterium]|nr:glycosyltransferase family 2 protein [Saprospiraceae bacterium]
MDTLISIIRWPEMVLLGYIGFSNLYFFVFALAALRYREKKSIQEITPSHILVMIPAYKEDAVIINTARAAIAHESAFHKIDVLVIADSFKPKTLETLRANQTNVLEVSFEESTKAKSIQLGLEQVPQEVDYVVVLDADNIMMPGCIDELVKRAQSGFKIVQGQRTAKNYNTDIAILDGFSEGVNNAIFRRGHRALGLSSSIIGSGFITESQLFRQLMKRAQATGGFDKEMELYLLEAGIKIGYANHAVILDEKVQKANAFVNQRRRWLSAQFIYLGKYFRKGLIALLTKGNIDLFDKVTQFLLPPRIIALGLSGVIGLGHLIYGFWFGFSLRDVLWIITLVLIVLAISISLPRASYRRLTLKSLFRLPQVFLLMLKALFKLKGADKSFIHTEHGIEETK